MKTRELTGRQADILGFIKDFIKERRYPPSLRDICARFGISSPKNVAKHLDAIEKKGFIRRSANISRAIEVIGGEIKGAAAFAAPIVGRVKAGPPHLAVEDIIGEVTLDGEFFKSRDVFILKVDGDSMMGAGIEEGDHVVVRPTPEAADGEIVVAMVDGEATMKRFFRDGENIILRPENPWLDTIEIKSEEGRQFQIIGKVIAVIKRFEK